jgi:hypothetical protein
VIDVSGRSQHQVARTFLHCSVVEKSVQAVVRLAPDNSASLAMEVRSQRVEREIANVSSMVE